ncbi:MAG: DUF418 domain-containing protein [Burkholderiaceae bacterium]|nr:DUF418 domain-containing protein [Burkholderiaceae bacterium]
MSPASPRLLNVDALRGFALLGILAVNIWAFADPYYATLGPNPAYLSALDQAVRSVVALLFESKFYLLFSFLFGYSVTLQMSAAQRAGAAFMPRMLRRQAGLLGLGVLHGLLLYNGDIMALYALLGLILLACRHRTPRRAVRTGCALLLTGGTIWLALGVLAWLSGVEMEDSGQEVQARLAAYGGNALHTLRYHMAHWAEAASFFILFQGSNALGMFFLGFAAGRSGLLEQPQRLDAIGRKVFLYALPLGLAGASVYTALTLQTADVTLHIMAFGVSMLTAPFLTAAYGFGLLALFKTAAGQRLQQALAPMGKMALSNYLGQSALLNLMFTGYGLGWSNQLPPLAVLACVPALFGAQMALSRWWLRRHAYGPGEWVLRAITTASAPRWTRDPAPHH